MVDKLLNIEQFFHWKFIWIKIKNYKEFGHTFGIVEKPSMCRI
jgi:hypothetical protein